MKNVPAFAFCLSGLLLHGGLRPARAAEPVVISEFMAANQDTLTDGFGNASDWIEIFNPGDTAVNLAGWHLTDDPLDLTKWTFPVVTLGPGQFRIVFASGLGAPDGAGNLHANFQLNSDGDYLALVHPDGITIASEFAPAFPPQRQDISYGVAQQTTSSNLLAGASARMLIPTVSSPTSWRGGDEPFEDSAWTPVALPIGFDSPRLPGPTTLVNVGLGRPVIAAGETWGGLPKENLTDGNLSTFTHNLNQEATFFFIVDLGGTYELENIELFNRNDGCCPDRLSNYTVSLLADTGPDPGPAVWSADIRTDGSNSGVGGRDLITPNLDPAGTFAGRWVKVQARNNGSLRYFQIAELRANAANWAQGAQVFASGPTWPGLPQENLTDGNPSTFSHNLDLAPAFAYQVRLTNTLTFRRIELLNRNDGCCPDRLSSYRVSLHPDLAGAIGPAVWSAEVRADGSSSGPGGVDAITAELDPAGTFEGQWIQIQNLDLGIGRYLQIAEVRAFGLAGSSGYGPSLGRDVTAEMKGINASAWLRVPFSLSGASNLSQLALRLRYDDGFVAYLNGVEIARRNAPDGTPAFDAAATASHFAASPEDFSLPVAQLREGANVLAVHALNLADDDRDFLLAPALVGTALLPGTRGYLLSPTPGGPNASAVVAGFVQDPGFHPDRGFFDAPVDVVITSPTPGATLVYTTNASLPSLTNGVQLAPADGESSITATVRVSTTTILRAASFKAGLQPSKVDTHTYLFLSNVIRQPILPAGFPSTWNGFAADYQMDPEVVTNAAYAGEILQDLHSIPTLSIVVNPSDLFGAVNGIYIFSEQVGDAWERAASIEWIQPDGSTGFQADCGIRIWGTGWRPHSASPKHAFQLKFQSQYGPRKLRYPVFPDAPVAEIDNMVLRAQGSRSWCDFRQPDIEQTQYIHDAWARDTRRDMGATDGHATFVHLYLNGLYWGLYNPVEKTDEGFGSAYYGLDKSQFDVVTRRFTPEADAGDLVAWNAMMGLVNGGLSSPEAYAQVQQYLDVDDFIDYMMLHQYASNHDGPTYNGNNMRALRPRVAGGQFRFHVWDMEYTFWYAQENNLSIDVDQSPARIFQRLRDNPEFRLRYGDRARRHLFNQGALTPGPAAARWLARATEIAGAVVGESARWGDVRRATPPYTRNVEWTNELNRLLNEYFPVRTQILIDQLKAAGLYPKIDPPSFSQHGGNVVPGFQLALDAPAGTVYYTLDGTDPRLPGGAIAPGAVAFVPTTPLVTTASTVRVFVPLDNALGTNWTGSVPGFNDAGWLAASNAAGFDVSVTPALSPVPLTNATADFSQSGQLVTALIDGNLTGGGWGLFQPDFVNKGRSAVAVCETVTNVGFAEGTRLLVTLRCNSGGQNTLGKYRLSATTDDRALFADGLANRGDVVANWQVLAPLSASSSGGATLKLAEDGSILAAGASPASDTNTITFLTPLTGITGLRLEAMEDSSLPNRGPGRSANGNAIVTDLSVQAAPATLGPLLDPPLAAQLRAALQNVNASVYLRAPFQVATGAVFHRLILRLRYEDGFVAYLNGREAARRNAPATPAWNSAATQNRPRGQALLFEEIDVTPVLDALVSGPNVLALHALNDEAASPDFLIQAELIAKTEAPVPLDDTTTVKARVWLNGEWSALNEATFTARVPLRFTEINYHPPGTPAVAGDEFEFIELKNTGTAAFNLSGLTFTEGISFTFPNGQILAPGAFAVLVRNPAQFAARYPGVPIGGVYSGGLDNDGETLTLARPNQGPRVLSVHYGDAAPWPVTPDGFGFTLVPRSTAAGLDFDSGANWRASSAPLGSPGQDDPAPAIPNVLVNEVLTASVPPAQDAIELFNPTAAVVNLAGWFLTDDRQQPKKFRIPDGSSLSPGGFVVFTEAQFNPPPPATGGFALDSAGDSIYLFSADDAGNLTGYSHGFHFGAADAGVSFGRHVISTGEERWPAQSSLTLQAPNAAPKIGPIVISEIHYHPAAGGDEFVELQNISPSAVSLFDPAHPTNTWKLDGLGYSLPAGIVLPSTARLLLVPTAPAEFRAKYGIPPEVQIAGPYTGQLQDSGERLELVHPGVPGSNGVPFIIVDEVRYNDRLPWPIVADGRGPSLHRLNVNAYGDDPANWLAAAPGPGAAFLGGVPPVVSTGPASQSVVRYQTAQFSVAASGSPPLSYQWQFQGHNLAQATNAILLLTNVQPAQAGGYAVTVFNPAGVATSQVATLTILNPPLILLAPASRNVGVGSNVTFSVVASGTGPLSYQWRRNGVPLAGATGASYTILGVQIADAGAYSVDVTDSIGTTPSPAAELVPLLVPVLLSAPGPQSVAVGASVTVSATASGYPFPFNFEWRRGSTPIVTNATFSATDFLTFTAPSTVTTQQYRVIVRNLANPGGSAANATFNIVTLPDTDGDGLPDAWESANNLNATNAADRLLDLDGDGASNWEEYVAGTDPQQPASVLRLEHPALASGSLTLDFQAISNRTYSLQASTDLKTGPWLRVINIPAGTENRIVSLTNTLSGAPKFYRVITPAR